MWVVSFLSPVGYSLGNDGFKQVAKTLVAASVVLAGDLKQEPLDGIQTAQRVAGNSVSEARPDHDELMLALAFGGARGAPHGIVEPAKLALGSGVHVAHAAHHDVGLIIQIEAIGDQLLDIDFGRAFGTPVTIAKRTPFSASFRTAAGASTIATTAIIAAIVGARPAASSRTAILTSRPIAFLFCL